MVTVPETHPAPLRRDRSHAVVGGVCAGLARRLGVDPLILRARASSSPPARAALGVALYAVCWAAAAGDRRRRAR